ncbi:MAG: SIS domain-containing protein [Rhizobiales bacterium]|nr:SIS domain-containing protein [Hyphomicrobiales bacterium]
MMTKPDHVPVGTFELHQYYSTLCDLLAKTKVTGGTGEPLDAANVVTSLVSLAQRTHANGNKLIFVGNGGSAAIASHMATDYTKNGNVRSMALNDSSMLTCLGNDLGYEQVFAKQIEMHARAGDLLIAISSSGRSVNILNAVKAGAAAGCTVVTLSGFSSKNPLRGLGEFNFFIDSDRYGFVEIGHLTICHAILDFLCGLRVEMPDGKASSAA